jgi:predicted restriction endonuclease
MVLPPILRAKCAVDTRYIHKEARRYYIRSGREMACAVCHYSKHVEICHIVAIAEHDDDDLIVVINALSNLVALCPTHHKEYDRGLLSQDKLQAIREAASEFPHTE